MLKNKFENIYIVGLGALGSIYAAKLSAVAPEAVKIIADEKRIATYLATGVTVNNKLYHFSFISPGTQQPQADLVIVAVKSNQLNAAVHDIREFIKKDTIVISVLNGIESEETIGKAIGMEHLLYAYAVGMDAVREGTAVTYSVPGKLVFGEKINAVHTDRVLALAALFERAQIPYQIPHDMTKALWFKFMMNVGINQVSAVLKAPYGVFQQNENALRVVLMAANEVVGLSASCGINLTQTDVDEFVHIMHTLHPQGKTSMLQDIEAGRKTEVDIFAGTVMKLGEKYGMPTPVNETLYYMIKAMEDAALS